MVDKIDEPRGELAIRTLAMPADANPSGDIFGGWVLSQMDIAGGISAAHRAQGRVVTVAVTAMTFHLPVYVGDVLCVYTAFEKIGRTSLTVQIDTWVLRGRGSKRVRVTEGQFVYVALGTDGRPRPVPNSRVPNNVVEV